ncbi:hypothetical protein BGZ94_006364, partial [Podila epigama]
MLTTTREAAGSIVGESTLQLSSLGSPSTSSGPFAVSGSPTPSSVRSGSSTPVNHHASSHSGHRVRSGHQLFAFNSEQQPWLTRLGFPRITLEVVDRVEEGEGGEEEEEERRRDLEEDESHGRRQNYIRHHHELDSQARQGGVSQRFSVPSSLERSLPRQPSGHDDDQEREQAEEEEEEEEEEEDEEYDADLAQALRESLAMHELYLARREREAAYVDADVAAAAVDAVATTATTAAE